MQLPTLTRTEMVRLFSVMGYPEKELALIAIVTGMTVAQICGLRWKRVNLSEREVLTSGNEVIPPLTVVVREEWVPGQLIDVAKKRETSHTILSPLLPILRRLMSRGEFTQPDDFVLVSRVGSPINPSNVLTRKLKPIGKGMNMPWLSWQHLRRLHRGFLNEFGIGFHDQMAGLVRTVSVRISGTKTTGAPSMRQNYHTSLGVQARPRRVRQGSKSRTPDDCHVRYLYVDLKQQIFGFG